MVWCLDMYPDEAGFEFFRVEKTAHSNNMVYFLEKAGKKRTFRCRLADLEKSRGRAHMSSSCYGF